MHRVEYRFGQLGVFLLERALQEVPGPGIEGEFPCNAQVILVALFQLVQAVGQAVRRLLDLALQCIVLGPLALNLPGELLQGCLERLDVLVGYFLAGRSLLRRSS